MHEYEAELEKIKEGKQKKDNPLEKKRRMEKHFEMLSVIHGRE